MQDAKTVLGVLRDRGRRGLPLQRVYRQLFNPALYLLAYGRLAKNKGALTPGVTAETADGMSLAKIDTIIGALRFERFRWAPVRRTYIPRKNGKVRPLGLPTWSSKLLQEVIRLILEAYYEPQFSDQSHGFRPTRGCHTALSTIHHGWTGSTWLIEGDISACFDSLDHEILLAILAEKIHDGRFLRLIADLLKAGYLEEWTFGRTLSGVPQGGVVSPVLSNIYLDRLDRFVERTLLPAYNRGIERPKVPEYQRMVMKAKRLERAGKRAAAKMLRRQFQAMPSRDPHAPGYRRLRYIRYADDFLLGFAGSRAEAEEIKHCIREFLSKDLKLELSEAKTLVTHARTEVARFLGYEVSVLQDDTRRLRRRRARTVNGGIRLGLPADFVLKKCATYMKCGKPVHLAERIHDDAFSIVAQYQQEFRGAAEYFQLATNLHRLNRLKWVMEQSATKTLARKFQISVHQVYRRYGTTLQTPHGPYKGLAVKVQRDGGKEPLVAQWGGIPLRHRRTAILNDQPAPVWNDRTELVERLLADECELCGTHEAVQVHHIRHLKDLKRRGRAPKPAWVQRMAARQRKTLAVCHPCHTAIHLGQPLGKTRT